MAVRGDYQCYRESSDSAADERSDPQSAVDLVLGIPSEQLQLRSHLGQRAELSDPAGSVINRSGTDEL